MPDDRIMYATAHFDQHEIAAITDCLSRGTDGLRIGRYVAEMERRIAELFGTGR